MNEGEVVLCLLGIFFILIIAAAVYNINKSKNQGKNAEANINRIMAGVPDEKQTLFFMQYNNSKKDVTTAILLALFLGGIGIHKFYLGNTLMGVLYLLFSWTGIPWIIAVIETFTMSTTVAKYNEQKAIEIRNMARY